MSLIGDENNLDVRIVCQQEVLSAVDLLISVTPIQRPTIESWVLLNRVFDIVQQSMSGCNRIKPLLRSSVIYGVDDDHGKGQHWLIGRFLKSCCSPTYKALYFLFQLSDSRRQ